MALTSDLHSSYLLLSWSLDMMSSATLLGGYSPPSQSPLRSAESDQWLSLPNPPSVYKTRSLSVTGSPAAAS